MTKPQLLARNERYTRRVNDLLTSLESRSVETLNRNPPGGGWSAIQTIYHLLLVEELSLAYIRKKMSFNAEAEPVNLLTRWRGFLLWASLSIPLKFKAPKNVSDEYLPDHATLAEARMKWQNARSAWTDFLTNMPDDLAAMALYKHPRVGRLGWSQMLSFFETHFSRHSKQIERALKN